MRSLVQLHVSETIGNDVIHKFTYKANQTIVIDL